MKTLFVLALFCLFIVPPAFADDYVRGYVKKDGTYVQPHYRSSRDNNPYNNYSTKGNTNPYTGKRGTKSPYGSSGSSRSYKTYRDRGGNVDIQSDGSGIYTPY